MLLGRHTLSERKGNQRIVSQLAEDYRLEIIGIKLWTGPQIIPEEMGGTKDAKESSRL
jgi:hypothetical protein